MRFNLEGLDVFFPYDYLYKEQYEYMLNLKRAIDDKGHVLLEMPTGTGKTVCLISLITSYQLQYPQTGKLIYCTRTVPEMTKCMEEIKRVIAYRTKMLGPEGGKVLALCLSSRRNMCIHPKVLEEGDRDTVDTLCRNMTASWVRAKVQGSAGSTGAGAGGLELCDFYENYSRDGSNAGRNFSNYLHPESEIELSGGVLHRGGAGRVFAGRPQGAGRGAGLVSVLHDAPPDPPLYYPRV